MPSITTLRIPSQTSLRDVSLRTNHPGLENPGYRHRIAPRCREFQRNPRRFFAKEHNFFSDCTAPRDWGRYKGSGDFDIARQHRVLTQAHPRGSLAQMLMCLADLQATIADQRLKMPARHLRFLDPRLLQTPEAVVLKSGMRRDRKEYNGWVIAKDAYAKRAFVVSESPWVKEVEWFIMSYSSLKRLSFKDCPSDGSLAELIDGIFEFNELFSPEQWKAF